MAVILVADPLGGTNAIQPDGGAVYLPPAEYSAGGYSIGAWVKLIVDDTPIAVWDYVVTLGTGSTYTLALVAERVGVTISVSLIVDGGSPLTFFTFQDTASPAFNHICLTFNTSQVTAIANGVVLGPPKVLLPVDGVTAKLNLGSMGSQYFDIVIHSKTLSNSTLLYYVQNLGELNPSE